MDEIKKIHPQDRVHAQWVATEFQKQGRGRGVNRWEFLKGNLAVSIWLDQRILGLPFNWIPLWVGYVLYSCLLRLKPEFSGRLQMKWPNDLMLDGKKVSGILCEGSSHWIAVGIGVNCTRAPDAFSATEVSIQAPVLLEALLKELKNGLALGPTEVLHAKIAETLSFRAGDRISWSEGVRVGLFHQLGPDGELWVLSNGQIEKLWAEDVRHVRELH